MQVYECESSRNWQSAREERPPRERHILALALCIADAQRKAAEMRKLNGTEEQIFTRHLRAERPHSAPFAMHIRYCLRAPLLPHKAAVTA
jgi:hypothetical protein